MRVNEAYQTVGMTWMPTEEFLRLNLVAMNTTGTYLHPLDKVAEMMELTGGVIVVLGLAMTVEGIEDRAVLMVFLCYCQEPKFIEIPVSKLDPNSVVRRDLSPSTPCPIHGKPQKVFEFLKDLTGQEPTP